MAGPGRKRVTKAAAGRPRDGAPSAAALAWLRRGLDQPGGKLPLFDEEGQRVDAALVRACLKAGWAAPWFENPLKPDWQVCRLTEAGRTLLASTPAATSEVSMVIPVSS